MRSITGERTVLKLQKSIYGTVVAPKLWFEHVMRGFRELGFEPSAYDPCFLIRKDMMVVVYVDDCGVAADDPKKIDELVRQLRDRGFDLEIEGDFTSFLGVEIKQHSATKFELLQTGLIDKVLATAKMTDCNINHIPAAKTPLGKNELEENWPQHPWKYSSVVGMLIYLATNSRPDITYAVSCAARFNSNPKQSHATAVKTILRYLKKTRDKGLIFNFDGTLDLNAYCDTDFAGLWKSEAPEDPSCARSRGGYIIFLGGIPLLWKSSLLSCITLSTLEAEYVQLSRTMTILLGLKNMLEELCPKLGLTPAHTTIRSTLFEDNSGAHTLATQQTITNRTRYLSQRWHHFWANVHRPEDGPPQAEHNWNDGKVRIVKCSSKANKADGMTKGQVRETFEANRKLTNGW